MYNKSRMIKSIIVIVCSCLFVGFVALDRIVSDESVGLIALLVPIMIILGVINVSVLREELYKRSRLLRF